VLSINGEPVISFLNIGEKVALGSREAVHLELQGPGDARPREVTMKPRYREREGFLSIDVVPASDPDRRLRVDPDSPAARAGLKDGDRLVGTESGLDGLSLEERVGDEMERARPVTLIVQRGDERVRAVVEPGPGPDPARSCSASRRRSIASRTCARTTPSSPRSACAKRTASSASPGSRSCAPATSSARSPRRRDR
jgi:hypothetical protein